MLGVAFGSLLGIAAAFLWDALDRRVRDETEVEATLGIPLLARILLDWRERRRASDLAMAEKPTELEAESIRRLRTSVEFANLDLKAKVLMVTSALPEEGSLLPLRISRLHSPTRADGRAGGPGSPQTFGRQALRGRPRPRTHGRGTQSCRPR
jgi:hypothetical protein